MKRLGPVSEKLDLVYENELFTPGKLYLFGF